jgi:glycosyltransferase involved in cell wall biosynthesis
MLATLPDARMYYWTLPEQMRRACRLRDRVPRSEALDAMTRARVMLAPSLVDGTPNSMFEAMAAGALPIVSPLETIIPLVEDERNVLFARNLYPEEIAAALVRAMTDDALVDEAAQRNLELVKRIANRDEVRARVVKFYESLALVGQV